MSDSTLFRNAKSKCDSDGTPRDMDPDVKQYYRDKLVEIHRQRDEQYNALCKTMSSHVDPDFMQYLKFAYHNAIDLNKEEKNRIAAMQKDNVNILDQNQRVNQNQNQNQNQNRNSQYVLNYDLEDRQEKREVAYERLISKINMSTIDKCDREFLNYIKQKKILGLSLDSNQKARLEKIIDDNPKN